MGDAWGIGEHGDEMRGPDAEADGRGGDGQPGQAFACPCLRRMREQCDGGERCQRANARGQEDKRWIVLNRTSVDDRHDWVSPPAVAGRGGEPRRSCPSTARRHAEGRSAPVQSLLSIIGWSLQRG